MDKTKTDQCAQILRFCSIGGHRGGSEGGDPHPSPFLNEKQKDVICDGTRVMYLFLDMTQAISFIGHECLFAHY